MPNQKTGETMTAEDAKLLGEAFPLGWMPTSPVLRARILVTYHALASSREEVERLREALGLIAAVTALATARERLACREAVASVRAESSEGDDALYEALAALDARGTP